MTDFPRHGFPERSKPIDLEPPGPASDVATIDLKDTCPLETGEHFRESSLSYPERLGHPALTVSDQGDLIRPESPERCEMHDDSPGGVSFLRDWGPRHIDWDWTRTLGLERGGRHDSAGLRGSGVIG
jgi:hypothetical protein